MREGREGNEEAHGSLILFLRWRDACRQGTDEPGVHL